MILKKIQVKPLRIIKSFRINDEKNYLKLITFVKQLAKKNPNLNIIIRPHPRQNINLVKNRFSKNSHNIKVIYEGVITPWIAACELYIHSGCTSFLEAASLEKKIIYVYENEDYKNQKCLKNMDTILIIIENVLNFYLKK